MNKSSYSHIQIGYDRFAIPSIFLKREFLEGLQHIEKLGTEVYQDGEYRYYRAGKADITIYLGPCVTYYDKDEAMSWTGVPSERGEK